MNQPTPEQADPADLPDDLPEQVRIRREKYDRLITDPQRAPFPVVVERTHSLAQIRQAYPDLAAGAETGVTVSVTGRVIFVRNTGKLCFATLREGGVELQVMLSADRVGAEALADWKADVDLGDQVVVSGEVISSRRGELSVLAGSWRLTAKALRPLPVAHRPMSEESRVRQRYVDLIVRPDARRMVLLRAQVLASLRATLNGLGFVEVETPILQSMHGGAAARPFHTHLNAFDQPMSLRIAHELYLKRALVGGIERVFEIGKTFRNEGIDSTHSAEFTMLEAYESYGDYNSVATWTQSLICDAARAVGIETPRTADGVEIELTSEWRWRSIYDLVSAAVDQPVTPDAGCRRTDGSSPTCEMSHSSRSGMPARLCWSCTRSWLNTHLFSRRSCATIRDRSGRWRLRTEPIRGWPRPGTWSSAASRLPPAIRNWPIRSSNAGCCRSNRWPLPPAIRRPCSWTRSFCRRWSTACRPAVEWAWGWTG